MEQKEAPLFDVRMISNDVSGDKTIELLCPFCHGILESYENTMPRAVTSELLMKALFHVEFTCPGNKRITIKQ